MYHHKGRRQLEFEQFYAACTPADISYRTDISLLNEAREKTEQLIDTLHELLIGLEKKMWT